MTRTQAGRRFAVLGTGIMGGPIARHLVRAGNQVVAWDRDRERLEALTAYGVEASQSGREAVAGADVLVTMLSDASSTVTVCAEALPGFGGIWIQSATVGVEGTERLLDLAVHHSVSMIDCPLLGTKSSAEAGELTALASGPVEIEDMCRALLEPYTRRVQWLGEAGRGSRMKLVVNNWVIGLTALTAETIALAQALGFSGGEFLELIADGPLDVTQAHVKGEMMLSDEFVPALPLRHAAKDARLIARAATAAGVELDVGSAVVRAFERAVDAGDGDHDMAAVFRSIAHSRAAATPPVAASSLAPGDDRPR